MNYHVLLIFVLYLEIISGNVFHIPLVKHKSIRSIAFSNINKLKGIGLDNTHLEVFRKPKPKPPGNDSIALYRYLDSEFYGIVKIGHKAQDFNMVFDTAWGDSWVMSVDCSPYNIACAVHNKYDHTHSSRYKEDGTKFVVNEGSYNISGYLSIDDINIGHSNISQQKFAEITDLPKLYATFKADGVIGLGLKSLASGTIPIFYNMIKQGLIKKPIFSVYMNRDKSSKKGGLITLGGIEERHILNNHTVMYLPIERTGYWQFSVKNIHMDDGQKSYPFCTKGCQAILDTSTTAIVGPQSSLIKLNKIIRAVHLAYNYYRVDCDTVKKLPKLKFMIGNGTFVLEGEDYIQQMGYNFLTVCITAFQPLSDPKVTDTWFLGGSFLAKYYSIFNLQDNTIGLVKAA